MSDAARKTPFPVRILGWLLASLSLLKLIEDITPIELYGIIGRWVEAYASLVDAAFRPIFGWIKFGEIEIEPSEHHAIVLCMIIGSAAGRANYQYKLKNDEDPWIVPTVLFAVSMFILFSAVWLLLAPAQTSLSFVLPGLGVTCVQLMADGEEDVLLPEDFRREMLAVLATLLILIVANYVLRAIQN